METTANPASDVLTHYSISMNLGRVLQQFDYSKEDEKEFTVAVCSPSGQSFVVGSFDRYTYCCCLLLKLIQTLPRSVF